ncbi:MAG: hypothetical protein NTU91_16345 [Chloroflexi bacterium]|nr:hypothetical protein [Chloroflexota bacterium]
MWCRDLALSALIASTLLAWPDALSAQGDAAAYLELAVGMALKPAYGESYPDGPMVSARVGRFLLPHAALRLEAELQSFGAGEPLVDNWSPCRSPGCSSQLQGLGAGPIRTVSALASFQYYQQADRRGFYVLAGFGPQYLASHPDRARAIRLAVQAGAGASLATVMVIEARYQASLGARAEPQHVVLISVGLRYTPRSRVPNQRRACVKTLSTRALVGR